VLPLLAYPYISKTGDFKALDNTGHVSGSYPGQDNAMQTAILFITGAQPGGDQALKTLRGISGIGKSAQL
jgi:hypothetical protein